MGIANINFEKLADTTDTSVAKRITAALPEPPGGPPLHNVVAWAFVVTCVVVCEVLCLIPAAFIADILKVDLMYILGPVFWISFLGSTIFAAGPVARFILTRYLGYEFYRLESEVEPLPSQPYESEFGDRRGRCLALLNSPHPLERDHLDQGLIDGTKDAPALISLKATQRHGLIIGGSEEGKTHRALVSMFWQLLLRAKTHGFSFRLHDLKGDEAEFHFARTACAEHGIPFDFITTDPRKYSMTLNPFNQRAWKLMSKTEQIQILAQALDLVPGGSWSSGFFADMIELLMDRFTRTFPLVSFKQILELLLDPRTLSKLKLTAKNWEHAGHFVAAINRMANIEPLNAEQSDIDLSRYYEEPRCLYVFAPVTLEPMSARVMSRLILHLDVTTARIMANGGK